MKLFNMIIISVMFSTNLFADCTNYYVEQYQSLKKAQFQAPKKIITNNGLHEIGMYTSGIGLGLASLGAFGYFSLGDSPETGYKNSTAGKIALGSMISGGIAAVVGGIIYLATQKKATDEELEKMQKEFHTQIIKKQIEIENVLSMAKEANFITPGYATTEDGQLMFQQVVAGANGADINDVVAKFAQEYESKTFCPDGDNWSLNQIKNYLVQFFIHN